MNVVDSSAWIEFFVDGPNAGIFEVPIHDTESLLVPTISVVEVYRYVLRRMGRAQALSVAVAMRQGRTLVLDEALAIEAAELGATHGLPLADSIIYASTVRHAATLWTQDTDFEGLEGVEYRPKKQVG